MREIPSLTISSPMASPILNIISKSNEQHEQHADGNEIAFLEHSGLNSSLLNSSSFLMIPFGPSIIIIDGIFNLGIANVRQFTDCIQIEIFSLKFNCFTNDFGSIFLY